MLPRVAERAKRVKIIYCKGGNTTSMAKHISIVHQIKAKCSTFDCLQIEKTPPVSCRTTDGPVLIIHSNYAVIAHTDIVASPVS